MFNKIGPRTPFNPHKNIADRLLLDVWGFGPNQEIPRAKAAACFYHYEELLDNRQLLDDQNTTLRDSNQQSADVSNLISILKTRSQHTVEDIHAYLKSNAPSWVQDSSNDSTIENIIHFAVRLWLFTKPDLSDKKMTLQQAIQAPLLTLTGGSNAWLWMDFSAAMLEKKAGFQMEYTSDISEHLTFASKSMIRIFSHACVLERYDVSSGLERQMYPPGFLKEVRKTLNLLWPMEVIETARHVRRLEEKHSIDIEANMGHEDKYDLRTYPVFGERLAKIQERLELEDNQRGSSRGFRIAIWGIGLTALFGLVSAITGIVSMWASLKQVGMVN